MLLLLLPLGMFVMVVLLGFLVKGMVVLTKGIEIQADSALIVQGLPHVYEMLSCMLVCRVTAVRVCVSIGVSAIVCD